MELNPDIILISPRDTKKTAVFVKIDSVQVPSWKLA